MIRMECPHCGGSLYFKDKHAGVSGRCRKCGGTITAPRLGEQAFTPPLHPRRTKRSTAKMRTFAICIAGIVVVLGLLSQLEFFSELRREVLTPNAGLGSEDVITEEDYKAVRIGMPFDDAKRILGTDGVAAGAIDVTGSGESADAAFLYQFDNPDHSNVRLTVHDALVIVKAENGIIRVPLQYDDSTVFWATLLAAQSIEDPSDAKLDSNFRSVQMWDGVAILSQHGKAYWVRDGVVHYANGLAMAASPSAIAAPIGIGFSEIEDAIANANDQKLDETSGFVPLVNAPPGSPRRGCRGARQACTCP